MGEILTRPGGPGSGSIGYKRVYSDAILTPPVRVESYIPLGPHPKGNNHEGRSKLAPTVEILNAHPGVWYKVAIGKSQTLEQVKLRVRALDNTIHFDKRNENGTWTLYAKAPDVY